MTPSAKLAEIHAKLTRGEKLTTREKKAVSQAKRPATHYATLEEAAVHYGVDRRALDRWREVYPEGFVKGERGYEAQKIAEARKRFMVQGTRPHLNQGDVEQANQDAGEDGPAYGTMEQLKLRKEWLACEKTAVQIDILLGKYARVDDILEQVRTVFYAIKDKFRRTPAELAYEVSGKSPAEAEDIIADAVDRVLNSIADHLDKLNTTLSTPPDDAEVKQSRAPQARESFVTR